MAFVVSATGRVAAFAGAQCAVLLIVEPLASLRAGFWLSFSAVAVLYLQWPLGAWGWQAMWLRPHGLIALGLFPMLWDTRSAHQPDRAAGQSDSRPLDQPGSAANSFAVTCCCLCPGWGKTCCGCQVA